MSMLSSLLSGLKAELDWFLSTLTYVSAAADAPPADTPADTAHVATNDGTAREHASGDQAVTLASLLPSHADDAQPHSPSRDADVGDFLHHVKADAVDGDAAPQAEQGGQLLTPVSSVSDFVVAQDPMPAAVDALSGLSTFKLDSGGAHKAAHDSSDDISFSAAPLYTSSPNIDFDNAVSSFANGHGGGRPGGGTGAWTDLIGSDGSLRFNITFDQAASNLPAGFVTDVENVAKYFIAHFNDNIVINVHVGYGEVAGYRVPASALGESITNTVPVGSYLTMRAHLLADTAPLAGIGDDGRSTLLLAPMTTDPTPGGNGNFLVSSAEAKALGISPSYTVDGYIGLSSFKNIFDYDTSNGMGSNQYDFYSVVAHEMSEVMGRMLFVGSSSNSYDPLDLFHFSTATGDHTFSGNVDGYFSIDGGTAHLHKFNPNPNGDFGDWASGQGTDDSYDAFGGLGVPAPIGPLWDLPVMDAIGWDRVA